MTDFQCSANFPSFLKGVGGGGGGALVVVRKAILKMLNETKSAVLKMKTSKLLIF